MSTVHFYFSIGSRYSYLAASQIADLKAETGCVVEWHPVNSIRLIEARDSNPFEGSPVSGQYEWAYREQDGVRWAQLYGIPFVEPRGRVEFDSNELALACTAAKRLDRVERFSQALFAAMFSGEVPRLDEAECVRWAEACGLLRGDFMREFHAEATTAQLDSTIGAALNAGAFGVPTFVLGEEIFWGNDRLVLLRHQLLLKKGSDK